MAQSETKLLFERTPVPLAVAKLAVPTVLSSLVMIAYNLADTYFIGMLNDPIQNAAVTLAAPLLLAFNAVNNLFVVGSSSMMSRALGGGNYELVSRSSAFGFYGALFFSLLFSFCCWIFEEPLLLLLGAERSTMAATSSYVGWTVLLGACPSILSVVFSYMIRAEGHSAQASCGIIGGCLLNILLDPIFALPWGLGMGVAGVAAATFISNSASCLYFITLILTGGGRSYISIRPSSLRLSRTVVFGVFGVGLSASVQNLLNVTGMTVLNNFTASYGTKAVAAMGIAQKVNMVPLYVLMGFAQGVAPLISYSFASKNYGRMKRTITFTTAIILAFSFASMALFYTAGGPVSAAFMKNAEVVGTAAALLRGFSLSLPFLCMDFMAVGVFQALGMGGDAFAFAVLRKVLLEIPALFLLNRYVGLTGLPCGQLAAEAVLCAAAVVILSRLFRRYSE